MTIVDVDAITVVEYPVETTEAAECLPACGLSLFYSSAAAVTDSAEAVTDADVAMTTA